MMLSKIVSRSCCQHFTSWFALTAEASLIALSSAVQHIAFEWT
jgi:hypothetical protein